MNIGIDHGYYAIKTRHFSFPAGISEYSHEPYTLQNTLEYGGQIPSSVDKGKSAGRGEKQALNAFSSSAGASLPSAVCEADKDFSRPDFSLTSAPAEFSWD